MNGKNDIVTFSMGRVRQAVAKTATRRSNSNIRNIEPHVTTMVTLFRQGLHSSSSSAETCLQDDRALNPPELYKYANETQVICSGFRIYMALPVGIFRINFSLSGRKC
eukprot:Gb_21362 [translate_table: standard]